MCGLRSLGRAVRLDYVCLWAGGAQLGAASDGPWHRQLFHRDCPATGAGEEWCDCAGAQTTTVTFCIDSTGRPYLQYNWRWRGVCRGVASLSPFPPFAHTFRAKRAFLWLESCISQGQEPRDRSFLWRVAINSLLC